MSFLEKIPEYIKDTQGEIDRLSKESVNIDWGHDCDCEYCDRRETGGDPEAEEKSERIDKAVKSNKRLIKQLEGYAELWGYDLQPAAPKDIK